MIVEPQSVETLQMAARALRSAADDLLKTDPTMEYRMPESSRHNVEMFARIVKADSVVRVRDVGYLIRMIVGDLEGKK